MWVILMSLHVLAFYHQSQGAKILGVLSSHSKSRYYNMRNLADELALRGHEVSLLLSSAVPFPPSDAVNHLVYQSPFEEDYLEKVFVPKVFGRSSSNVIENYKSWVEAFKTTCRSLLIYVKNNLQEFHEFELMFGDTPASCGVIVADLLELPRIDISPAFLMRMGVMEMGPISYSPVLWSFNTDKMNFIERAENLLHYITSQALNQYIAYGGFDDLKRELDIMPERSFLDSTNAAELLIVMGHFALEYTQPILPGVKLVGPLTIRPTKALPRDIEEFVNGAGDKGVVLLSLGTLGDHALQKNQVDMLADALGRLEQRVIWRLKSYIPQNLASNIKVVSWIPQLDLLAHNNTKVFLSHTGHNSLYEAAFYGVPLVCIPLLGDQFSNCLQAQSVGMALGVDIKTTTKDEVYHSIQRVLKETSFKGNATRVSRLLSDSPRTSAQQAADWIEYVHRHKGAKHLRPEVYNLHWYQRYLLDILAFILFVLIFIIFVIRMLLKCLCDILSRRTTKTENIKTD